MPARHVHRRVRVRLGARSYSIHVGEGLLRRLPELLSDLLTPARPIWLISDSNVNRLHGRALAARLERAGHRVELSTIPAGESSKSLTRLETLSRTGLRRGVHRDALLLALGGGVVGDLAGFLAGVYLRGLEWAQLPTTLLAQVDASVGGKVAVNLGAYKNSVGLFLQPAAVVADTGALRTLPPREFRCGLAEAIKMAAVLSRADFAWLERHAPRFSPSMPASTLEELVVRSARLKARVVELDEREAGPRALLNFGHTLAHALEGAAGYRGLLHGEAVAVGCAFAADLSVESGRLAPSDRDRLVRLLEAAGLPTRPPRDFRAGRLLEWIRADKKQSRKGLGFVLTGPLGDGSVSRLSDEVGLERALARFLEGRPAAKEGP